MTSVYHSERLAVKYAFDRPPVHEEILRSVHLGPLANRALDVGCGAGKSTAALIPLAQRVVGVEPIATMLTHRRQVAPEAQFVTGSAEALPFAAGSFDLISAAGSLNYTDLPLALAEIARVLAPAGSFLLYDFSEGRQALSNNSLAAGLHLLNYTDLEIALPMNLDTYMRYALSELNVDGAITAGLTTVDEAADWCQSTLAEVFGQGQQTVLFHGYLAHLAHLPDR